MAQIWYYLRLGAAWFEYESLISAEIEAHALYPLAGVTYLTWEQFKAGRGL